MNLCIGELAELVDGELTLGSLPPLAGAYEPVRRIVVESQQAKPGDVYWALAGRGYDGAPLAVDAYLRGALGVVVAGRHMEPFAGRFSIRVPDANAALLQLASCLAFRKPRKSRVRDGDAATTQLVQALIAGLPVNLETILDRLARRVPAVVVS
jgi:UDP-N-acetylmuramyl pentapeptide synthase